MADHYESNAGSVQPPQAKDVSVQLEGQEVSATAGTLGALVGAAYGGTGGNETVASVAFGKGADVPVLTTYPPALLRHNISDEELNWFAEQPRSGVSEWFFFALGVVVSTVLPALEMTSQIRSDKPISLSLGQLVTFIVFVLSVAGSIALFFVKRKRDKAVDTRIASIRSRTAR